jgi:hypothetical protein
MNLVSKDTAILVTVYTGGNDPDYFNCGDDSVIQHKRHMAKTLAKYLQKSGYYVCYSSHSTIDEETQKYCHLVIYDSDNRWQIDGVPARPNHGVAEMSAIINGVNVLSRHGFKNVLKLCYDQHPNLDISKLVNKFESMNKKLITLQDAYGIGTLSFFSDIEFLKTTLSMKEIYRLNEPVERGWLASIREKGLEHELYGYSSYSEMLEFDSNTPDHFASLQQSGSLMHTYNY